MLSAEKKKWVWIILIASGMMVLAYDLGMLVRNRLRPCQPTEQNCEGRTYCSQATPQSAARCLPLPGLPTFILAAPLKPFECIQGNLRSPEHAQDNSAFRLKLKAKPGSIVESAHSGIAFYYPDTQEARVVHDDGYTSYYYPLETSRFQSGDRIAMGSPLGRASNVLHFGVYYLNPSVSEAAHKAGPQMGFSIPFQLQIADRTTSSLQLECSHPLAGEILKR